jgi:predicted transcriptional regulator
MESRAALISIHPNYAQKIVSGEKRVEFRRCWAVHPVHSVLVYATFPTQRFVAIAEIKRITFACPTKLWKISKSVGGGISREKLFEYLIGKDEAVAIEFLLFG